ncbi:MAG: NfeD family protein [Chryseolinea sp.]
MLIWIIIISLLLVGLALTIIELFFVPGTTVVGILGLIFSIAGIVVSYNHLGSPTAKYILTGMLVVSLVAFVVSFRSGAWSKFSLKTSMDGRVNEGILSTINIGDEGITLSNLRPVGKAEFNQKAYEVKTTGSFVESGAKVKITQIESHQIVVEPLKLI